MSDAAPPANATVTVTIGETAPFCPADADDVVQALAFALRYQGRKRFDSAREAMARITAERLVEHLRMAGFVVMRGREGRRSPDRHDRTAFEPR